MAGPEYGWSEPEPAVPERRCTHGVNIEVDWCQACESTCVHGNYGPTCPDCREGNW